jgi:hypothetical protein
MNLHQEFERELANIGTGSADALDVDVAPRHLHCDIAERNSLAVSFNQLQLATPELANADAATLERIGKALSSKLTYLMEPISPIEFDAQGCVVQLRSAPPLRDDDGRAYYELLVHRGGEISLARYRKDNGGARRRIAATVTREVLLRLANDFCTALE